MTGKGQMAMAVGAGYMLGRTHKMKLALMLAGFGASRRFPTGSLGVLNEGRKLLADSPEVAKLGVTVRKELMNAVKAAAVTAASQRIDSLNTRLESGEDLVGGKAVGGKKKSKRARVEEPEDEYEGEAYAEDEGEPDDEGDNETGDDDSEQAPRGRRRPAPRRRSSSGGSSRPTRSRSRSSKDDDEEDDLARARARRTRAKATTDSVPVRRRTRK